jgi:hypothetical protein
MILRIFAAAMALGTATPLYADPSAATRVAVTCHAQDQMVCDIKHDNCLRTCAEPAKCVKKCCEALEDCRRFSSCPERARGCST